MFVRRCRGDISPLPSSKPSTGFAVAVQLTRRAIVRQRIFSLVLGAGEEGDVILDRILQEMPGVVVKSWLFELDGPEEHIRRGSSHEAFLALMRSRLPGETPMSFIRKELSLTNSAYKDLLETLRDETHSLCKALAEIGVRYVSRGPGKPGFLLKS